MTTPPTLLDPIGPGRLPQIIHEAKKRAAPARRLPDPQHRDFLLARAGDRLAVRVARMRPPRLEIVRLFPAGTEGGEVGQGGGDEGAGGGGGGGAVEEGVDVGGGDVDDGAEGGGVLLEDGHGFGGGDGAGVARCG